MLTVILRAYANFTTFICAWFVCTCIDCKRLIAFSNVWSQMDFRVSLSPECERLIVCVRPRSNTYGIWFKCHQKSAKLPASRPAERDTPKYIQNRPPNDRLIFCKYCTSTTFIMISLHTPQQQRTKKSEFVNSIQGIKFVHRCANEWCHQKCKSRLLCS